MAELPGIVLNPDGLFRFLILVISGLTVTVLVFAVMTVILRWRNERKALAWERLERKWDPLVVDVIDGALAPEQLWRVVHRGEEVFFLSYLLRYARRVAGQERMVINELARPYLGHILPQSQDRSAERRARAVQTVGELGLPDHADAIVAALDDRSQLVAMIAASALAVHPSEDSEAAVMAHLDRFTEWRPTYLAAVLAAPGPSVAPLLRESLIDQDRTPAVRRIAAIALMILRDPAAADPAYVIATEETDRDLRASVLRLLALVGRPEHLAGIRDLAGSSDPVLRGAACGALGALGAAEDRALLEQATLEDPSSWVALQAARGLLAAGGRDSLARLAASDHQRTALAIQVLSEERS
jgi:HEAT repeat protein